jgi:hypothetical protein
MLERTFYRLADEPRKTILVACSKCEWNAAYERAELITAHGTACPIPSLLEHLASPGRPRLGSHWDRCGVHYLEPVEGPRNSPRPRFDVTRIARQREKPLRERSHLLGWPERMITRGSVCAALSCSCFNFSRAARVPPSSKALIYHC